MGFDTFCSHPIVAPAIKRLGSTLRRGDLAVLTPVNPGKRK